MKPVFYWLFPIILFTSSINIYAQITFSKIDTIEKTVYQKPELYDSLSGFTYSSNLSDYKKYIGLKLYLPHQNNPEIVTRKSDLPRIHRLHEPFLFSYNPKLIFIESYTNKHLRLFQSTYGDRDMNERRKFVDTVDYSHVYTHVYKPYHYGSTNCYAYKGDCRGNVYRAGSGGKLEAYISNDMSEISDKYYTIIDVLYSTKLEEFLNKMDSIINITVDEVDRVLNRHYRIISNVRSSYISDVSPSNKWSLFEKKYFVHYKDFFKKRNWNFREDVLFVLRSDLNGDTIYCTDINKFVLVPFFVKMKEIYEGNYFIYDNPNALEYEDMRFVENIEDRYGGFYKSYKKITIKPKSKWFCKDVSLIKPNFFDDNLGKFKNKYLMSFVFSNNSDQIIFFYSHPSYDNLKFFILEEDYIEREKEKRMHAAQIKTIRDREERIRIENEKRIIKERKKQAVEKFGLEIGELVAKNLVSINMSKEMCKFSWGDPYWKSKTTTEYNVYESWFYGFGKSLHFINGYLKRVEE